MKRRQHEKRERLIMKHRNHVNESSNERPVIECEIVSLDVLEATLIQMSGEGNSLDGFLKGLLVIRGSLSNSQAIERIISSGIINLINSMLLLQAEDLNLVKEATL